MAGKLNERQARFVAEYLVDLNATQAAIRAGYSQRTAYRTGADNLKKPQIAEAIREAMEDREARTNITADRVLRELAAIAFADPADYQRIRRGRLTLNGTEDIPRDKRRAVQGYRRTRDGPEVVLGDKMRALELLMKHLGMLDKKEETDSGGVNVVLRGELEEWGK